VARIRTVKPEFFRHEGLQDLEAASPGAHCMLVFAGLWGHCDKNGVFEWKPRQLKLDILPFLEFDLNATLALLMGAGFIRKYAVNGREYGVIDTFADHQRVTGKEWTEPAKFPTEDGRESDKDAPEKQQGNAGETNGKQQGESSRSGREGKGRDSASVPDVSPTKRAKPRTLISPDLPLDDGMREAALKRFPDCDAEEMHRQFVAHHVAKGSLMASWRAAWTTWIGNAERFGYPKRRAASNGIHAGVVMR
jgi:hypothetical protein